jgi:Isochorismatase family
MTTRNGNLWKTLGNYLSETSGSNFALLVIDEQGGQRAQTDLLLHSMMLSVSLAQKYGFGRIIFVELSTNQVKITGGKLAKAINVDYTIFYKKTFNAFAEVTNGESDLHGYLQKIGVKEVVIMGQQGGQCVKLTAIGGPEGNPQNPGPFVKGAVGYGYRVWTTPAIVQSNDKGVDLKWMNDNSDIIAYSML